MREYKIESRRGRYGDWERPVHVHFVEHHGKGKALDEDAKFIKNTVHDEMDSFSRIGVLTFSVHNLPYHPSVVSFFRTVAFVANTKGTSHEICDIFRSRGRKHFPQ